MHAMRILTWFKVVALVLGSLSAANANAAERLDIAYIYQKSQPIDGSVQAFADELLRRLRLNADFAAKFDRVEFVPIEYTDDVEKLPSKATIAILTPLKYAEFHALRESKLHPLLVAQKGPSKLPYYSAVAVASKDSPISRIGHAGVKRMVLMRDGSLSGNAAPLTLMWQMGLIEHPSIEALNKVTQVTVVDRHSEVLAEVKRDIGAIGFTWAQPDMTSVKVIVRWGSYPQDVVCISDDLQPFGSIIADNLVKLAAEISASPNAKLGSLDVAPFYVAGFVPFVEEHENGVAHLGVMRTRMRASQSIALPAWAWVWIFGACLAWMLRLITDGTLRTKLSMVARGRRILLFSAFAVADILICVMLVFIVPMRLGLSYKLWLIFSAVPREASTFALVAAASLVLGPLCARFSITKYLIDEGGPKLLKTVKAKVDGFSKSATDAKNQAKKDEEGDSTLQDVNAENPPDPGAPTPDIGDAHKPGVTTPQEIEKKPDASEKAS